MKDIRFLSYIQTYDIIHLCECWIPKNFELELTDFVVHVIPRRFTKHTQGGGSVILIRKNLSQNISLVSTRFDTIIWLKVDKLILPYDHDLFIACVYIPPSNSTYYNTYGCDLFYELENDVSKFSIMGILYWLVISIVGRVKIQIILRMMLFMTHFVISCLLFLYITMMKILVTVLILIKP